MSPRTAGLLFNFIAFQFGWFACVMGAARGWPLTGTAIGAVIVAWHIVRAARPREELKLIGVALLIGVLWDSALIAFGLTDFTSGTLLVGLAPPWILALWALFSTTLNLSLRWLRQRWLLAALLGAVAGPLSYWAGARLGAVQLVAPWPALIALSIGWALMTPVLVIVASRCDGMHASA
ncbi:MAG: DUF2878 domain-containing protein [Steroidobacteraceae bacterium]